MELRGSVVDITRLVGNLKRYAEAVIQWNQTISNIISSNDEGRFVERHIVESLAALSMAKSMGAGKWVDLGSGAGVPAIPLVMAGIGDEWCLVESRRTKSLFLRKFVRDAELRNVAVICDRAESLVDQTEWSGRFDAMTSRATLKLGPTLDIGRKLLRGGGQLLAWKGSGGRSEWEALPGEARAGWEIAEARELSAAGTTILRFRRDEDT